MRKLTITAAIITALAALTTFASTIAIAALPEFLPTTKVKFTGFSGPGALVISGGNALECESDTATAKSRDPKKAR